MSSGRGTNGSWRQAACLIVALSAMAVSPAAAQTAAYDQTYSVSNVAAGEAVARLSALLPPGAAARVDQTTGAIVVTGAAPAQDLAAQVLAAIDSAAPAAQPSSEPVMKVHAFSEGLADAAVAQLRGEFPPATGVRFTTAPGRGQIIVSGPESMQHAVAQRINALRAAPEQLAAAEATAEVSQAPPVAEPVTRRRLEVSGAVWDSLAPQLESFWGAPKSQRNAGDELIVDYRPPLGAPLRVIFNQRSGEVTLEGGEKQTAGWSRVIEAMVGDDRLETTSRVIGLRDADRASVRRVLDIYGAGAQAFAFATQSMGRFAASNLLSNLFRQVDQEPAEEGDEFFDDQPLDQGGNLPPQVPLGIMGDVRIEFMEDLGVIIIEGPDEDVARVQQIIADIERLSEETAPITVVHQLQHVNSAAVASLVRTVYAEVLEPRQGSVSITELNKPNALLLIGRDASVQSVVNLVEKLDVEAPPETEFEVFQLKHAVSDVVVETINAFYDFQGQDDADEDASAGLRPIVFATSDFRTNSVIVRASPRDLKEVARLISQIDVVSSGAVNQLRVFQLKNSRVEDVAETLQAAITQASRAGGTQNTQVVPGLQNQQQGGGGFGQQGQQGQGNLSQQATTQKSITVEFSTVDANGQKILRSGLLSDVRISADQRGNSLLVTAPAETMELIGALIEQLDQVPVAQMQIKVFAIKYSDAASMQTMLSELFNTEAQNQGGGGFGGGGQNADSSVVPLTVSIDQRTNSLIASGSADDLLVVEALVARLDDPGVEERKTGIYQLKHTGAADVAATLQEWLQAEREVQLEAQDSTNPFQQIEREVIVSAEPVSNVLVISATERYYDQVMELIEEIDEKPKMVSIQVLLAEVQLTNNDEFGIELGLQDSVLFDRSIVGDLLTISQTSQTAGNDQITTQNIVSSSATPGFLFNGDPLNLGSTAGLGNGLNSTSTPNASRVGTQGLTNFALGRASDLGYGGFVFSASSNAVSVLMRALQACRKTQILARPTVTVVENQQAFVQSGFRFPRVTGSTVTQTGVVQATINQELENVGVLLLVTPYITENNEVSLIIDAERSDFSTTQPAIQVGVGNAGAITSPVIDVNKVSTVVNADDGQTIVLGGLIGKSRIEESRRVPGLSRIPILGHLFRYDSDTKRRSELIIIMTPRILHDDDEIERLKAVESSRMSWCLADAVDIHGDVGLSARNQVWDGEGEIVVNASELDGYEIIESNETPLPADAEAPAGVYPGVAPDAFDDAPTPGPIYDPSRTPAPRVIDPAQGTLHMPAQPTPNGAAPRQAVPTAAQPNAGQVPVRTYQPAIGAVSPAAGTLPRTRG